MDALMARAEKNWANHTSLREANIALDQLYALGTPEATAAAWELQEAIENFELETMYGFEPITHGGMGADNRPVDILGESSSATINAEMNEAIVTIVVEENKKEQMQALQGQMLASMGAVSVSSLGLAKMATWDDDKKIYKDIPSGMVLANTFDVSEISVIKGGDNFNVPDKVEIFSGGNLISDFGGKEFRYEWPKIPLANWYDKGLIVGDQITIKITAGFNPDPNGRQYSNFQYTVTNASLYESWLYGASRPSFDGNPVLLYRR